MHKKITWVLVADGARAAFFHNDGPGKGLEPIFELGEHRHGADTHEMMSDKQGSMRGGPGTSGSAALLPRHDPHEAEEKRFVEHLAKELDEAVKAKRFDRLIIAAPPRALGNIRKALSTATAKLVSAEYDKDLTRSSPADIAKHLEDHLAV
ncbi:MAG TPA: host attachment protein [Dongiaceae bacterium]|jgi:protein required for attachment to host cells|nr:host attachment protein [Dongiaceae bacterium]